MKKARLFSGSLAVGCLLSLAAAAETPSSGVAACIAKTRAPGSYDIVRTAPVPVVEAEAGGTRIGARNVNDCLQDAYQVQYDGMSGNSRVAAAVDTEEACRADRERRIAIGLVLTVGTVAALGGSDGAVIGGVVGTAAGVGGLNERYRDCVARARGGRPVVARGTGYCRDGAAVLQGGSGYCVRR